jgi:prepilin-type N-terminal cleavage/methylation domain-containing protein
MYLSRSEKGFSLVELMATIGILGGIVLVTMRLLEEQTNKEALIRSRAEIQKMVSLVRTNLANPNNCRLNLNSYFINIIGVSYANGIDLPGIKAYIPRTGGTKNLLTANTNYNHFETQAIKVRYYEDNKVKIDLNFKYKKKSTDGRNAGNWSYVKETLIYKVTISTNIGSSLRITDCGEVISASNNTAKEKFCKSLGMAATWDGTNGRCSFTQMTCPFGMVVMKLNTLGGVYCGPIKDYIKLDSLFEVSTCTNTSGKYRIVSNGAGKLKVECVP